MPRSRAALRAAVGAALLAPACTRPAADRDAPTAPSEPLALGPIAFFEGRCARCHGSMGAMFGPALAALDDDGLAAAIRGMVEGPAQATLGPRDLDAQAALHRSFIDRRPFLAVTARGPGFIEGEVTPGASVTVIAGATRVAADVREFTWRAAAAGADRAFLEARLDDRVTRLAPDRSCSHPRR